MEMNGHSSEFEIKSILAIWLCRKTFEVILEEDQLNLSSSEGMARADFLHKHLYAYGRNIEKCLAMCDKYETLPTDGPSHDEATRQLYDQLVRMADRVGKDELFRRLRKGEPEPRDVRLDPVGEARSTSGSTAE